MTTPERPDGTLAHWQPDSHPAAAHAPAAWDEPSAYDAGAAEPARRLSVRVVMRAVRRHWWQILLIWGAASGGLMTLAYLRVRPSYEAVAYVEIEQPAKSFIPGTAVGTGATIESQLETQAQRITTPDVLGLAVKDPKVAALSRVQSALDAEAAIRKDLRVMIVPRTRFITISLSSPSSSESVAIVNAVATSYHKSVEDLTAADIRKQTQRLQQFFEELTKQVEEKQTYLRELAKTIDRHVGVGPDDLNGQDDRTADQQIREKEVLSLEEFKASAAQLNAIELNLMEDERHLDRLKAKKKESEASVKLVRAIEQELQARPEVVQIYEEYDRARQRYERAKGMVRPGDIVLVESRRQMEKLKGKYQATADRLRPLIRQRLERDLAGSSDRDIREAEDKIAGLQARREGLQQKMKAMKVESSKLGRVLQKDSLEFRLAEQDLADRRGLKDHIQRNLEAMRIDAETGGNKIYLTLAKETLLPTTNNRTKMMAAAPVGTLAVVLGLFVLLEVGAGRVADPEDLPGRLHLGVIGVVPPLPPAEPSRNALPWGGGQDRARRKVEEFVQSLDHLRVQLWAGRRPGAGHRCVLITSACVSEGKTTLAAQLAGRCANAGLSTLLIDADLRRPALARLLEVPGEPGLSDVLTGEIEPEAAMVVIGNAGGFHLMPAGSRGHDPGRLLQQEKLGELLARLRETFDIIIVDAPPVLPVPDALILGRWTDGAVLAVRHDSSRYPMVERAQHKLASVGVPILGAVVNGVKGGGSAYGNYAYSSAQGDRHGSI